MSLLRPLWRKAIEEMVKSLMTPSGRQAHAYLPGIYPQSPSSSDYMTVFTTSRHTAEETMFWTAGEGGATLSTPDGETPITQPPLAANIVEKKMNQVEAEWSSW